MGRTIVRNGVRIILPDTPESDYRAMKSRIEDFNRKQRMAGDKPLALEGITGADLYSTSGEDKLNAAYTSLQNKVNEFGRLNRQLNDAGIATPDAVQALDTGVLIGGAPGPVRQFSSQGETRRFLDWEDNEITGQKERVPFKDPSTGDPLSQLFGMLDLGPGERANELVQENALKLAGFDAGPNNMTPGLEHYSDHIVNLPDGSVNRVEGKIRLSDIGPTDNLPVEGVSLNTSKRGRQMAAEVRSLIERRMRQPDHLNMIEATEALIQEGVLNPPGQMKNRLGKALRSDPKFMTDPDGIYDSMIVTGYPKELQYYDDDFRSDKLAVAPDDIYFVNHLQAAKRWIEQKRNPRMLVTPNRGESGYGPERAFVQAVIPLNAEYAGQRIYKDLAKARPNVRQITNLGPEGDYSQYEKRPRQ